MKNATFRQLRVFTEVAKHLSFARAAEALHLTPPAVTMQVKELEGHVGLPLFDRQGRTGKTEVFGDFSENPKLTEGGVLHSVKP